MKIYSADKSELMQVAKIERDGNDLVIKGKVFGTMPRSARRAEAADPGSYIFPYHSPFSQRISHAEP
jgi:hypothetical protein